MPAELVLDASVAAKVFIPEDRSDLAEAVVLSGARLIAPEFVLLELASVAAKRFRRADIPRSLAQRMIAGARALFNELVPASALVDRAFALAADHGLSAYDAAYVALAAQRACELVTADARLVAKVNADALPVAIRAL